MKIRSHLIFALLFFAFPAFSQLTIKVVAIPDNTPENSEIYIAGNFQNWDPGNSNFILANNGADTFEITLDPPAGLLEFKFTRGSWETVEGNEGGGFRPNRQLEYDGSPRTETLEILSWEDLGGGGNASSTAADNVFIFEEDFPIPQLNRSRRIWIYLPPDYDTSEKKYPVLYMQDGQNVFDAATSFAGEWEVDESLNALFEQGDYGCIVVAIDNGGSHRIDEYSPWQNPSFGGGEGAAYLDFIVETLKPQIDSSFRTLSGREFTGLFGSSMGGLISHYGIIEHQDVFGKAGVFSPSFAFFGESFSHTAETPHSAAIKIYLLAGGNEDPQLVNGTNQMFAVLQNAGYSDDEIFMDIPPDGQHSEWFWAREFPAAYLWLFGDLVLTATSEPVVEQVKIYPNPLDSVFKIEHFELLKNPKMEIFSVEGKLLKKKRLRGDTVDISFLRPGIYILRISSKKESVLTEKLIVN